MPFDLSTAKPIEESTGFDLSSAKPIEENNKNAEPTVKEQNSSAINNVVKFENGTVTQKGIPVKDANIVNGIKQNVYIKKDEVEKLSELLFTSEELQEIDSKGPISWIEGFQKLKPKEYLPGGGIKQAYDTGKLLIISKKLEAGESVSDEDKAYLKDTLREDIKMQRRGLSWGGAFTYYGSQIPAFMIEFAITGGLGKAAGTAATKAAAKVGLNIAKKGALKTIKRSAIKTVGTSAKVAARMLAMPARYTPEIAERRISDNLAITDKGELILQESEENPAISFFKAFLTTGIEVGSEMTGTAIGNKLIKPISNTAFSMLPIKIQRAFIDGAKELRPLQSVESIYKKGGFDGIVEEYGEERLADLLNTALDLDKEEGHSLDQYFEALFPDKDQVLLELGLFTTIGSMSISASSITKKLKKIGKSSEEINNILKNTTALEKEKLMKDLSNENAENREVVNIDESEQPNIDDKSNQKIKHNDEQGFDKFYSDWVNKLQPLENLEKKAMEKSELKQSERPALLARTYAGSVGATRQQIEEYTFEINEKGDVQITGEGFQPILKDFDFQFKPLEQKQEKRQQDLKDFLIAQRFLQDLSNKDNVVVSEQQKLNSIKTMSELSEKYGENFVYFEDYANRIYQYQQRILKNLVSSGNISQEQYDTILKENPNYIPFNRVIEEENTGYISPKSRFSEAKASKVIKKIKGSEKEIKDPFENVLRNTFKVLDVAYKNKVAKSIANLSDVMPEYIQKKKPLLEKGKAVLKVAYDAKMRKKLEEAIKYFGGKIEYKKSLNNAGKKGLILGDYNPLENKVRKRLGAQDRTLAHEFGHLLDFAFGIESKIKSNKKIQKEINKLAEQRFISDIKLETENTESSDFVEETKEPLNDKYIKSQKEMIANVLDLYFTSRDLVKNEAPNSFKFIENLFEKNNVEFLKNITPSAETAIEEVEQDVWIQSKLKPFGNVIEYYEDGKKKYVEVSKPIYEAINELSPVQLGFIEKLFQAGASVFRAGATLTPDFWVRNVIRDQMTAKIQSKSNFIPFVDMAKGLSSLIKKDNAYREWMASGGSFNSYMDLSDKSMQQAMKELIKPEGKVSRYLKTFGIGALEDISMSLEQATRIGMFAQAKGKGLSSLESALESREGTLDFARSGSKGRVKNRYVPFLNANIQGTDKLIRTFRDNPQIALFWGGATITLPSILLTGYYLYSAPEEDRQEYLEIPQWQKDSFWCFKVGGDWWRMPKPYTIGYLFGSVPERVMSWSHKENTNYGKEVFEMATGLFNSMSPIQDVSGMMHPWVKISIEIISNYNFFTGHNIYADWMNRLEPSERKNKYTSETANLIGEKFDVSPALVEHAVKGAIASSSRYLFDAGDSIINAVKKWNGEEIPERPLTPSDIAVIRSFAIRNPEGSRSISVQNFYETWKKIQQKHATYNRKKGEEKLKYFEENIKELKAYKAVNNFYKQISSINKQIDRVYEDKNMTSEEKTQSIAELENRITEIARDANIWIKDLLSEL